MYASEIINTRTSLRLKSIPKLVLNLGVYITTYNMSTNEQYTTVMKKESYSLIIRFPPRPRQSWQSPRSLPLHIFALPQ